MEVRHMEDVYEDCYIVFVRDGSDTVWQPEAAEQPAATCLSYSEAARIRQELRQSGRSCIIRCVGQAGGGD
jgi:hypothetical protein